MWGYQIVSFKLCHSSSAATRFYGTPKMQKFWYTFDILSPIVLSIGTFNYDLSHFFFDLLSPVVPHDYSYKDTFLFCF